MRWFGIGLFLFLAGCDAWPTRVFNETKTTITFQYWNRKNVEKSAPFSLLTHEQALLDRDMFIKDIKEIDIVEGNKAYHWGSNDLAEFRRQCPDVCGLYYSAGGHLRTGPYGGLGPNDGYNEYQGTSSSTEN